MSAKKSGKIENLNFRFLTSKIENSDFRFSPIFCRTFFENFSVDFFSKIFSSSSKKYFFSELRFFFGYSFDVKLSDLLIYDVFRAFGVRQIWFPAPTRYCAGTKTCSISRVFWVLVRNRPFSPLQNFQNRFSSAKKNIFFRSWKKSWVSISNRNLLNFPFLRFIARFRHFKAV